MNTQIVGYTDEKGTKGRAILAGVEISNTVKGKLFEDAKNRHKYPKGFARIEVESTDTVEVSIFCGDHVADELESYQAVADGKAKAKAKIVADANKRIRDLQAAKKNISITAVNRATAQSASIAARNRLDDAKAQAAALPDDKALKGNVDKLQPLADKAQAAFEAADKTWLAAKEALNALENPNLTADANAKA